jgi:hypothetical protein
MIGVACPAEMKNLLYIPITILMILLLLPSCSREGVLTGPEDTTVTTGGITGKITDAMTGLAIAGAIVSTTPPTQSVTTGVDGNYQWIDVAPGSYTVKVSKYGYVSGTVTVYVAAGRSTVADLALEPGANGAPEIPHTPVPAHGAAVQAGNVQLRWQCSDPEGDVLTYDVFYGRENPPAGIISSGRQNPEFELVGLQDGRHYWKILARDSRGNVTEGPVWNFQIGTQQTVKDSNALLFDGGDTYVLMSNTSNMNLNGGNFTVETWIRVDKIRAGNDRWGCIVTRANSNEAADFLLLIEGDKIVFQSRNLNNVLFSNRSIAPGVWYHVAGVHDVALGAMRMYINGEPAGEKAITGAIVNPAAQVFIGARDYFGSGNPANVFSGIIHEVRIWDRVRSQTEIIQSMTSRLTLPQSGLLAYWQLKEGAGLSVGDGSGNNRTGQIKNGASWVRTALPIQ